MGKSASTHDPYDPFKKLTHLNHRPIVYSVAKHDAREAARRAGPSVTADTCLHHSEREHVLINVSRVPAALHSAGVDRPATERTIPEWRTVCITYDGWNMKVLGFFNFVMDSQYSSLVLICCQNLCYSIYCS